MEFNKAELAHIRAALIIMRDMDSANSWEPNDECDESAKLSAELIYRIETETEIA